MSEIYSDEFASYDGLLGNPPTKWLECKGKFSRKKSIVRGALGSGLVKASEDFMTCRFYMTFVDVAIIFAYATKDGKESAVFHSIPRCPAGGGSPRHQWYSLCRMGTANN